MSHRYRKTQPTMRMYRHFAVITVALTGLIAVFAEGEKAAAGGHEPDVRQLPADAVDAADRHKPAAEPTVHRAAGTWGSEAGPSIAGGQTTVAASWWPNLSRSGYSSEYLAALSEAERQTLEAAIAENTGGAWNEPKAISAQLEAASRARSGSAGRD